MKITTTTTKTTNMLTTLAIGALLALGGAALAQPPEPQPEGQRQPGPRGPAEAPPPPPAAAEGPQRPAAQAPGPIAPGAIAPGSVSPGAFAPRPVPEPNVDLAELVQRVAEETGREFLIDPTRAATRIYLGGTIEGTPSYPVLVSILRLHGLVVFETEGIVNIVPDGNARAVPTRIVQVDNDSIPDDEIVTRVLTLPDDVSGAPLVPVLRPMMPATAHLTALQSGNKLVIVDTYANVRRMTEVIRSLVGSVGL